MVSVTGATSPFWLYVLLPFLVFGVGLSALLVGSWQHIKAWLLSRHYRRELLETALILMMGRKAVPEAGREEIVGFKDIVPALDARVKQLEEKMSRAEEVDESMLRLIREIQQDVRHLKGVGH